MAKPATLLTLTATVTLLLLLLNISFGSSYISPFELLQLPFGRNQDLAEILWAFRLPKAVTCLLTGAALGTGGLLMQTLFRNPLAGPDVLGLSSGSSLLVALVIMLGQSNIAILQLVAGSPWSLAIAATLGSALVFVLMIVISRFIKDNTSILIIGLMLSAATTSVVGMLLYVSKSEDLQLFMIWSLGNVGGTNWKEILVLACVISIGISIAISQVKSLNARLLGDTYAQSLGIPLAQSRFWLVAATSLMVGSVTAFCGPIAFVGLAVPHLVKLVVPSSNHRIILPLVMLGGACLLLFCDVLTHAFGTTILPLNAVTSIIGAPLVIWMVVKNKKMTL